VDESPTIVGDEQLLAEVLRMVDASTDADRAGSLEAFARSYLRRLPPDAVTDPETAFHQIRGLFELLEQRSTPIAVRAFNPTPETHGYASRGSVIEVNVVDAPFLHDSITNEIHAHGLDVRWSAHPVVGVERDDAGRLVAIRHARHTTERESVQHIELDRRLFDADLPGVERALRVVIEDVMRVVSDFHRMVGRIDRMTDLVRVASGALPEAEIDEYVSFLEWLRNDNFIFLGYREYRMFDTDGDKAVQVVPESGLGLLSVAEESSVASPVALSELPPDVARRFEKGDLVVITKTNRQSPVHRRAKMDYVGVRMLGRGGETVGEARLVGLFTSKAYMEPASKIPILRRKLSEIMAAEDLIAGSHDHKAVIQIFDGFSKHDLFAASTDDLRRAVMGLLALQERQQVRLFVRRDLYLRSVSVIVALPRDRFNAGLRKDLQDLLVERFGASSIEYHLELGEADPAQIHFTVWIESGTVPEVDYHELESEVIALTRSWRDRVVDRLAAAVGEERAVELADRWADRFPEYYLASTQLGVAAGDIRRIDELVTGDRPFVVGIQNEDPSHSGDGMQLTRIALYRRGGKRPLTELVPALEDLGLDVIEEIPTRLEGSENLFIHDFGVLHRTSGLLPVDRCGSPVRDALEAVWSGEVETDTLHRLVIDAGLTHRQVEILRAYRTYWRRVRPVFTVAYVNETLVSNPGLAASLVELFEHRFRPDGSEDDERRLREEILEALDRIPSLDEDRILRAFYRMILTTVRTNAFVPGRGALAFKLRSEDVPDMPKPHPMAEIFVIGPGVEGIHLRGGPIARGGIRWSTRREDYRTEVLGLMKAQMTKNAVIVPTGAKGGFVLRRTPEDGAALRAEVEAQYRFFVRSLLELTDDRRGGEVVHPDGMRIHDGEDPYLVVAADKGTATFSDVANAIAAEQGFWLDDAFASGGSTGYDHKQLGITARGAWESLLRHFREMGIDPATDTFTAVGIGDMSGDVFGNGMLLSDRMQLVAAFDHRHVFLDPSPDPAVSHAERRRLFELPRSSWDDYDRDLISDGGGVWPRTAKRIELSEQVRTALGTDVEEATPDEVIRMILRAEVDLIWNGGIGTYVKGSAESDEEVGDRATDPVRVDADTLRARVVVEGGNLGFTQRARIEFARRGGRINTDFIDNSGGVDCSDREVNLKILLGIAEERGLLDREARNALVATAADSVVGRILYDNFQQAQMLSQEELNSARRMEAYEDLMASLERGNGLLDRTIDNLPSTEEMSERARNGQGLTRPELAVLLVDAKRSLKDAIIESELPDAPYLLADLAAYFPPEIAERFEDLLAEHPLRRELVATIVANDVVNSQGATFISRLCSQTGAEPAEVVKAYRIARDVSEAVPHWQAVEELFGTVPLEIWTELMDDADRLVASLTRWFLAHGNGHTIAESVDGYLEGFRACAGLAMQIGPPDWTEEIEERSSALEAAGVPAAVSARHVLVPILLHAPDAVDVAGRIGRPVQDVLAAFMGVGRAIYLDRLAEIAREMRPATSWQRWALQTVEDDLVTLRRRVVDRMLERGAGLDPDDAVAHYLVERSNAVARLVRFMREFDGAPTDDVAPLMVAVRQVRALAG
jgi:glutamate dehydrogenase